MTKAKTKKRKRKNKRQSANVVLVPEEEEEENIAKNSAIDYEQFSKQIEKLPLSEILLKLYEWGAISDTEFKKKIKMVWSCNIPSCEHKTKIGAWIHYYINKIFGRS